MKYAINVTLKAVYYNRKNRLLRLLYHNETGTRPLDRTEMRPDFETLTFWGVRYVQTFIELTENGENVNALLLKREAQKIFLRLLLNLFNVYNFNVFNKFINDRYINELAEKAGLTLEF